MKSAVAITVFMSVITVAGCSAIPDTSRLPGYQSSAEELAAELHEAIPSDLLREDDIGFTSNGVAMPNATSTDRSRDSAYWSLHWRIPVVDLPASKDAADAVAAELESRGWQGEYLRTTEGGTRITDEWRGEYAGEEWYVQISHEENSTREFNMIELSVVSPTTVRGDEIIH